ncbi:hypothetical protein NECAME_14083 [Necator americanus]|uniref:Uncharacterized protein n=1 Tax=Necator americanus TaxID=51031 RepID=W2ST08_NECAM|nr:hypothetical protein NECAME_14083 [Necator americanus]ETN71812.1 hypothetical protein NECAME_14083 [Necator americanus]
MDLGRVKNRRRFSFMDVEEDDDDQKRLSLENLTKKRNMTEFWSSRRGRVVNGRFNAFSVPEGFLAKKVVEMLERVLVGRREARRNNEDNLDALLLTAPLTLDRSLSAVQECGVLLLVDLLLLEQADSQVTLGTGPQTALTDSKLAEGVAESRNVGKDEHNKEYER